MAQVLVSYFSKSGNTEKMAQAVVEGLKNIEGLKVILKTVEETDNDDLAAADCLLIGSPCYFGTCAAEVKGLIDGSIKVFGQLKGKVGGAFCSSGHLAGGNETTILSILQGLLVHGMVIQGLQQGNHYGPVSVRTPEESAIRECIRYGKQMGELTIRLFS